MAEKKSNPFADHPVLSQTILLISFITSNIAIFDKTNLVFMLSVGCIIFAYMNMRVPKKFNPKAYEFRPTNNGALLAAIAIICAGYGAYAYIKDHKKETAVANVKIYDVMVDSRIVPAGHALWPYRSRSGHSLPWKLAYENNLNSWANRPANMPKFQLVEYRDMDANDTEQYFKNCKNLVSLYDGYCDVCKLSVQDDKSLSRYRNFEDSLDSFVFDISLDDGRDITSWIDSYTVTVHQFYTYPPDMPLKTVSAREYGFSRDETVHLFVPLKKLDQELPWSFDATYCITKSTQTIPTAFELDKPQIKNKTLRTIDTKIMPLEPGFYVYSASMIIKDSKGGEKTYELIPSKYPRTLMVVGTFNPAIRGKDVVENTRYEDPRLANYFNDLESEQRAASSSVIDNGHDAEPAPPAPPPPIPNERTQPF